MNVAFREIGIGEQFIAIVKGIGATAFIKISARKARCFMDGKMKVVEFKASDIVKKLS